MVEDLSDAQANLAQMKAALSGNPLIVQHVELSMQVQQLETLGATGAVSPVRCNKPAWSANKSSLTAPGTGAGGSCR